MKEHSLDEGRARNEPDMVFVETQEIKKSHPREEEANTTHGEVAELNAQNEESEMNSRNSLAETTALKEEVR